MGLLVHLPHRRLISLSGRDTFKYLQALTTNNLSTPSSQFTSFLNAQGRVLYEAFIYRTGEQECLVETDARNIEALIGHLKRYKLRSKFDLRVVDDGERQVYQFTSQKISSLPNSILLKDPRAPDMGHRVLSPASPSQELEIATSCLSEYMKLRYRSAVPEGPDELIAEKALPMESNIDFMHGLDFHKGCYLGQELTVRTHHTGVIRKRIVPLTISPAAQDKSIKEDAVWHPEAENACNITIPSASGIKSRPAGRLLGSIGSLGIGLLRLDQIGQTGTAVVNGVEMSVTATRPGHWPQRPESV